MAAGKSWIQAIPAPTTKSVHQGTAVEGSVYHSAETRKMIMRVIAVQRAVRSDATSRSVILHLVDGYIPAAGAGLSKLDVTVMYIVHMCAVRSILLTRTTTVILTFLQINAKTLYQAQNLEGDAIVQAIQTRTGTVMWFITIQALVARVQAIARLAVTAMSQGAASQAQNTVIPGHG